MKCFAGISICEHFLKFGLAIVFIQKNSKLDLFFKFIGTIVFCGSPPYQFKYYLKFWDNLYIPKNSVSIINPHLNHCQTNFLSLFFHLHDNGWNFLELCSERNPEDCGEKWVYLPHCWVDVPILLVSFSKLSKDVARYC